MERVSSLSITYSAVSCIRNQDIIQCAEVWLAFIFRKQEKTKEIGIPAGVEEEIGAGQCLENCLF